MFNSIEKLKRWWNCSNEIEQLERKYQNLSQVVHHVSKEHPEVILWIDKNIINESIETKASLVVFSGENLFVDNLYLSFNRPASGASAVFISDTNNARIQNSSFVNLEYDEMYKEYNNAMQELNSTRAKFRSSHLMQKERTTNVKSKITT